MLIHDVALMGLHMVFGVDRAGIVGRDGETHQGAFDVSYLCSVPGMRVYAPSNFREMRSMLRKAVLEDTGPVAVRYPRGGEGLWKADTSGETVRVVKPGTDVTIVAYGTEINEAIMAARMLSGSGVSAQVLKINTLCPLDTDAVMDAVRQTGALLVAEEACAAGCVGRQLLAAAEESGVSLRAAKLVNLGSGLLEHGAPEDLRRKTGLDNASLAEQVLEMLHGKDET